MDTAEAADSSKAAPDKAHGNTDRRNTVHRRIRRYNTDYPDIAEEVFAAEVLTESLVEVFAVEVLTEYLAEVFETEVLTEYLAEVFETAAELVFEAVLQAESYAAVKKPV